MGQIFKYFKSAKKYHKKRHLKTKERETQQHPKEIIQNKIKWCETDKTTAKLWIN